MHADTKAKLLSLESELQTKMQTLESKTQAELAAMKIEMRQLRQALMHGENEKRFVVDNVIQYIYNATLTYRVCVVICTSIRSAPEVLY